jgi:hypothetical protein
MKRLWPPTWQVPLVIRSLVAGGLAIWSAVFLANWLARSQPLSKWFFFDLATIWLWNLYLSLACVVAGQRVVRTLLPSRDRTVLETVALSFPVGLVLFVMGMYAGGFLGLYGRVFAVALPLVLIAAGAESAILAWSDRTRARPILTLQGLPLVLSVLGVLLLGVLYLGVISPDAINYDASWVHMVIPQDYAREGRIIAFPGDQVKNVPHFQAMVATWGFLVPGLPIPALRWMMALHLEFMVFVWTLVGVAATTRWLAAREIAGTWVAFALFPSIYVYDSNLGGASDHFLALFSVPLVLVADKVLRHFDRRTAVLGGLIAGGAVLSKFQAIYVLGPLAVWAVVRVVVSLVRRLSGDATSPSLPVMAKAIGLTAAVAVVVTLPHFLSNWVFYSNPMYPFLSEVFRGSHPAVSDGAMQAKMVVADWNWKPPAELGERLSKGLRMMFTFSFEPHYSFVNNLPVFGSVFTLSLPLLVAIKGARRLWLGAAIAMGAVLMWALSYWVDRNLQTFMPVLVAVTAAILIRAWELGWLARLGVSALVVIQIAWATPLYFSGNDRMTGALTMLRAAMDGRARDQLANYRSQYVALGEALPKKAVVLLHTQHIMLGIDRTVYLDWIGFQTIIDYRTFKTPRDMYDHLRKIGVTHIVLTPGLRPSFTRQEEAIFDVFIQRYGTEKQHFSDLTVFKMPDSPPPVEAPYQVVMVGISGYPDGLYPVTALGNCFSYPPIMQYQAAPSRTAPSPASLLDDANVVMVGTQAALDAATNERLGQEFRKVQSYGDFRVLHRGR